ncbi:MAG: hypothetical protein CVU05_11690 [Bacteroidetes bacterium HGW-Bacteroidetes-21]|nr:MAG: hypothetical protein CVU05_11690 [Bacteroidetes bacterium HGW-Bacteroidetes-21]
MINDFVESQIDIDSITFKGYLLDSISLSFDYYYKINDINRIFDTCLFSIEDIDCMENQVMCFEKYQYWHEILKNKMIIISDKIVEKELIENRWEGYRNKYGKGFYEISIPIFNAKGNKAIVIIRYNCGGFCGYTKVQVFSRKNDNWIKIWEKSKGTR